MMRVGANIKKVATNLGRNGSNATQNNNGKNVNGSNTTQKKYRTVPRQNKVARK